MGRPSHPLSYLNMKHLYFYIAILMTVISLPVRSQDYVDNINLHSSASDGQSVIYEMNVGAFTPSGTFAAAVAKLSELKQLGVDIIWLMPVYPRGGGINSPYAATNFQQVNSSYGTLSDLKNFVTEAHKKNMRVWIDWVPNHTATNADWVSSHPEYYTIKNGQMVHPNNYNDVWELNYSNSGLQSAMNDCLKFWIDQTDIDGFRCDYVSSPTIPASYWTTTISLIKNYKAGKRIHFLGEADIPKDATRLINVGFDYDYAWQFQSQLADYGSGGNTAARLRAFANTLLDYSNGISFARMLYVTNHDQNWNESRQTLTAKYGDNRYPLTVFAYTLYGMPLIYNGQETGGNQALNYFNDTKIDWTASDAKMKNTIRTLCALKHSVTALSDKSSVEWKTVTNLTTYPGVLAYSRKQGDSEVLVVLNMATSNASPTIVGLSSGEWSLWLDSETIGQGTSRKQVTLNSTNSFNIPAKGYKVYVKGKFSEEELPPIEPYIPMLDYADEISIFFETPNNDTYAAWVWGALGGGEAYCTNTSWPGDIMQLMGQTESGNFIYKQTFTRTSSIPSFLIISKNNGNTKIYDGVDFVNHGYYVEGSNTPDKVITDMAQTTKKGDVNEDGKIDINDVVAVINQMAGTATWRYADVNEDKKVDINDVVNIINIMAGI